MMKLKVPPALMAALFGTMMWAVDRFFHPQLVTFTVWKWVYHLVFAAGIAVGLAALYEFIRHRTTIDPHSPAGARQLVTTGIYKISRNPMYLALFICLVGFGLKLGNMFSFMPIPAFVFYMNRFQIIPEEEILYLKFGDTYTDYVSHVRRWI